MTKQIKIALQLPLGDARYALESVAEAMLMNGVSKKAALPSLHIAAKRMLRMSLADAVSAKVLDAEARKLAVKLLAA